MCESVLSHFSSLILAYRDIWRALTKRRPSLPNSLGDAWKLTEPSTNLLLAADSTSWEARIGFWSHRGGSIPHDNMGELAKLVENDAYAKVLKPFFAKFDHLEGKDLLKEDHLSDVDGWKLEMRLIPYRQFPSASKRPQIVTELDRRISSWESWYEWRGLSKESPAALLMSFPLSAYWLITHCLQLTRASAGRPEKRACTLLAQRFN